MPFKMAWKLPGNHFWSLLSIFPFGNATAADLETASKMAWKMPENHFRRLPSIPFWKRDSRWLGNGVQKGLGATSKPHPESVLNTLLETQSPLTWKLCRKGLGSTSEPHRKSVLEDPLGNATTADLETVSKRAWEPHLNHIGSLSLNTLLETQWPLTWKLCRKGAWECIRTTSEVCSWTPSWKRNDRWLGNGVQDGAEPAYQPHQKPVFDTLLETQRAYLAPLTDFFPSQKPSGVWSSCFQPLQPLLQSSVSKWDPKWAFEEGFWKLQKVQKGSKSTWDNIFICIYCTVNQYFKYGMNQLVMIEVQGMKWIFCENCGFSTQVILQVSHKPGINRSDSGPRASDQ